METLLGLLILLALLGVGFSFLTGQLGGRGRRNPFGGIAFRVARWILLATLVIMLMPFLLVLLIGAWLLFPESRIWPNYWGHTLANATTGLWRWAFGPQKVRIHRKPHRHALNRRMRYNNWRN